MANVLSIPLILREILQNFSTTELLELSLVNKEWNHEARSLMRHRGNLTGQINKTGTCQDLRAFALDLRRMTDMKKVIPFSGINIALGRYKWGYMDSCEESSSAGELDDVYNDMLNQIIWKHLSVSMDYSWQKCKNCPALLLVAKILQKYGCVLDELSLQLRNQREFSQVLLQGCSFPRLKSLRIQKWNTPRYSMEADKEDTILIKTLVCTAPNLRVMYTEDPVNLEANLLERSSALHVADYEYSPSRGQIPESVAGQLRMQRMRLDRIDLDFNIEKFNRIAFTLLHNSRMTLNWMAIAPVFLVPLMHCGIILENVRTLRLMFTDKGLEFRQPLLWRIVKSFDFARFFPNLSTLHISWIFSFDFPSLSSVFNDMIEQQSAALMEPIVLDRAENIKSLRLDWGGDIRDPFIKFFAQMVPHVQKLEIRQEDIPFTKIWDSWPDLKEFVVIIDVFSIREKFDSAFCGIFPEEIAQLQTKDDEYLRRVNVVPVMPSITCLKGLRTLNMSFNNDDPSGNRRVDDRALVFSKVTGLIAFQRLPALVVNLKTNNERTKEYLNNLKRYASVILGKIDASD